MFAAWVSQALIQAAPAKAVASEKGVGGGGQSTPPLLKIPTPKKVRGGQILSILIVVRLKIKNLEVSDFLSIKIVNFFDFLPVRNTKSLTF